MNQSSSSLRDGGSQAVMKHHYRLMHRRLKVILISVLLLLVGFFVDVMTGPAWLSFQDVWQSLLSIGADHTSISVIVWQVRLPTACLAILVGASLSLAGVEMQTILQNPLASPFTLGVSSAAAFGAALVIVAGIGLPFVPADFVVPANAFVMAFGTVMIIQVFAQGRNRGAAALVLFGIAMVFGFNALVSVIQFISPAASLQQLVFWIMGSLNRADFTSVAILAVVLVGTFPFAYRAAWRLTLLELGEERARSLGVSIRFLRFGCLLRASLLASVAVAFVGPIGFVGLIGPHIARMMIGDDHRFLLPGALLAGAIIMSFAGILAKLVLPGVILPIGIVTTLVGLPVFVGLLMRRGSGL